MMLLVPYAAVQDPVSFLINYGALGIFVILFVTGRIGTKSEVDGLKKALVDSIERERQKDIALTGLMQQITQHTVPQLSNLARVVEALPQATEADKQRRIEDLQRRIAEIEQTRP